MATKAERLAEKVRKVKAKLAKQKKLLAIQELRERVRLEKGVQARRYHVGTMAHEAGLFTWSNADLADMFEVLASLGNVPKPVVALQQLLDEEASAERDALEEYIAEIPPRPSVCGPQETAETITPLSDTPKGIVYVIQMQGHPWLKIGHTYGGIPALRHRVATLQIGCPQPLHVRRAYACELPKNLEHRLHRVLAEVRRTGEWFATDVATIDAAVQSLWDPIYAWDETTDREADGQAVTVRESHPSHESNVPLL